MGWGLTHVYRAVVPDQHVQWRHQADDRGETRGGPAAVVDKVEERGPGRRPRSSDPERNDDAEDAAEVQDEHDAFDQRQADGQEGVEQDRRRDDGDGQERGVPGLRDVALVVERDEALDDAAHHETHAGEIYLPADGAEPA